MLALNDGRSELWQWDTGRKLTVDVECSQVHFSNRVFGRSIDVDVVDGVAIIPDILLQTDKDLTVWAFVGKPENGYTKISKVFKVNKRNKPADYVFTPTEQTTLEEILERVEDLEENPNVDVDLTGYVKSVNGQTPDENGNVTIEVPDAEVDLTVAVLYTKQELTEEQKARARENIGAADAELLSPLTEAQTITSVNLYDPSLQTEETISPHYWYNGAPYSTTQFDSTYHCTAPIPVEPDTTYTVGYLTGDGSVRKPWGRSNQGVHFFDADGAFLGITESNTFTTPSGTAYFRMNYAYTTEINLNRLNANCMLVLGNTLPTRYVAFGSYTTSSAIDRLARYSPPIQYHIDNNVLKVASHYSAEKDLLVTMNLGRGNGLFDFASFKLMPRDMDIVSGEAFADTLATNGTDWHAPFIVRATDNADGDDVGSAYFTGGNHQYNNQGSGSSATARSLSLRFFVDGREVVSEKGYANTIEIRWANNVQGYNTRKADGTGREILQERHRLIFDGIEWSETIDLEPLESVFMERWYGLQFVYSTNYPNYRYIGAADRMLHTSEASNCGGKNADGIIAYGDEHRIEMNIDTSVDLGKRTLSGETGALCSSGKAYMFIIDYKQMNAGEVYRLCGGYKFMPQ